MTAADVRDAFEMLSAFLTADEHYLASSAAYGDRGLRGLNGLSWVSYGWPATIRV
jgi:hypothetical protein